MHQEKLGKLEKESERHKERLSYLENSLDNIKPLIIEIKEMTKVMHEQSLALTEHTLSNKENARMLDRVIRRQDASELDSRNLHDEIAAARPAIKLMNELSKKMMYFGLAMVTISIIALGLLTKGSLS